jgi:hypothetical protein
MYENIDLLGPVWLHYSIASTNSTVGYIVMVLWITHETWLVSTPCSSEK